MRRQHADAEGAALLEQLGSAYHRACGVDHVVDDDGVPVLDFADDPQGLHLVADVWRPPLVDERHLGIQVGGISRRQLHPAGIRGDHGARAFERLLDVVDEQRHGGEVVERGRDETLDLTGVEIDRHDAVGTGGREEISHQAG